MKKFHYLAMATLFTAAMTSCSDDDSSWTDEPDLPSTSDCAYVLTQGNVYNNIEGGLNVINYDGNVNVNVFKAANKRSLGDTAVRSGIRLEDLHRHVPVEHNRNH